MTTKNDKHFKVFAATLDNRAVLRVTDTRTMAMREYEIGLDKDEPYFIKEPIVEEPKDDGEEE